MIKIIKYSCISALCLLLFSTIAHAEETTKFANLNDTSNSATIIFNSVEQIEDTNTFSVADIVSHDSFIVIDNSLPASPKLTKEVIEAEVMPEITQIKDIVKTEIERLEEEKEAEARAERLRIQEENRRRLTQVNSSTQKSTQTQQKTIEVDTSNADGGSLESILKAQLGKPYVYGGNGPNSFDCSGLAKYVYGKIGVTLPRVASDQQHVGTEVERSIESLKFGDLVFFAPPGNTRATHVGIYVGDGQMIHAPQTGDVVKYANIFSGYYKNRFFLAKRVL